MRLCAAYGPALSVVRALQCFNSRVEAGFFAGMCTFWFAQHVQSSALWEAPFENAKQIPIC